MRASHLFNSILILSPWLLPQAARAQIIPDATLPANTAVTVDGSTLRIEGGTAAGSNLFHSFQEFSLPTGSTAYFNNSPTIQNILTRVTGGNLSNIDGLIRANGSANLFFINPSGLVFGPNARLNIGGSFIGSTANSIQLSDGSFFSATHPETSPLLTVNVPIGLQFGSNPGAIRVTGTGHALTTTTSRLSPLLKNSSDIGLSVSSGNTLALIGGDVSLDGGVLNAPEGRIELGSVGEGFASLNFIPEGLRIDYTGAVSFRDIRLAQLSLVDASGAGGGSISVQARNVSASGGSLISIQNQGTNPSGNLTVNASEEVRLTDNTPDAKIPSFLNSETIASGNAGDISVATKRLVVENGAAIATQSFSAGQGGNINVSASETVDLNGFSAANLSLSSFIFAVAYNSGQAGNITVNTGRLTARNGGGVISSTFGIGAGGNVSIQASESIELTGVVPGIFTPSLLSASTLIAGNAGSLNISTGKLIVRDGGRVDASTVGAGSAGSVTINAAESVEISGTVPGSISPSLIVSSGNLLDKILQETFGLPAVPSGDSKDVTINTPVLRVTDGAQITVRNDGTGNAGAIAINAGSIFLDSKGSISASTTSGEGGNINLRVRDSLLLRNGSFISAEAGGSGNGGNLTVQAATIAALENSDITANAARGRGGNIAIATRGLFGTQFRPLQTPASDITASSQLGLSGTVTLSNPEVNQNSAFVELPHNLANSAQQIVAGCAADSGNVFAVTGRGGLPSDPTTKLRGATVWSDLRPLRENLGHRVELGHDNQNNSPSPNSPILEATGIAIDATGKITLVAIAPGITSGESWQKFAQCGGF